VSAPEPSSGPAPGRGLAARVLGAIEALSTAFGWLSGWLIVPMTLAVAYEVAARYAFNAPTIWAYDVTYMLFGAQFMLAAAYTLLKGGHIRTDVFYERWSPRTRSLVDAVGYVFFFFPGMLFILYASAGEAWNSFLIGEKSDWTPWRPVLWPMKMVIPLTAALMVLQGISELVKCVRVIRGPGR
jgi:TRAP-type mannitol/chloroaromatic compound transport system permease small subunit